MKRHAHDKGGFVLVSVVLLSVVLESFATVSLIQQIQEMRLQKYNEMKTQTFYAAQGAIDQGLTFLADRTANFALNQIRISPNPDVFPVTYSDGSTSASYFFRCYPNVPNAIFLQDCPTYDLVENGQNKTARDIEIIVNATHPQNSSLTSLIGLNVSSQVHQVATIKETGIFSYAVFYNSDLEMMPSANMTMSGNIHANGSIYLATQSGQQLTLDSTSVHATQDFYRYRKDAPTSAMSGSVRVRKNGETGACNDTTCPKMTLQPYDAVTLDSRNVDWDALATSTWNGSVKSAGHGVGYIQPLSLPSIQPTGSDAYFANSAGLRILATNSSVVATNASGTDITAALQSCGVLSEKSFRNNRENANYDVKVTEVNIGNLNTCNGGAYFPSNGLIYASRTDAVSASGQTQAVSHGIRLTNGSQVGPVGYSGGVTVVTNNPLYIQGNFNVAERKSIAVISDAINILSNSWGGTGTNLGDSATTLSNRMVDAATGSTTVNAGFISGIVPTPSSPGPYSGGLENYPRFLENWSGKTISINGAFINLWNSSIGNGQWLYGGNHYTAPLRVWGYDPALKSNPPPFTPLAVEIDTSNSANSNAMWWQNMGESSYL